MKATTGIAGCCARAASGHAAGRQAPTERQGIYADSVGGSERAANNIKCLRFILNSIKGERDILRSPDFGCGDLNTEHVGFPLRLAHY
jgi:hypothetical protein